MNHVCHYSPHRKLRARKIDVNGGQAGGFGHEPDLVEGTFQPANEHFAIQGGDDHFAVGGFNRAVDDDDIAVEDARADHGVAVHPHKKCRRFIPYQVLVKVDTMIRMCLVVYAIFIFCAEELLDFHKQDV